MAWRPVSLAKLCRPRLYEVLARKRLFDVLDRCRENPSLTGSAHPRAAARPGAAAGSIPGGLIRQTTPVCDRAGDLARPALGQAARARQISRPKRMNGPNHPRKTRVSIQPRPPWMTIDASPA